MREPFSAPFYLARQSETTGPSQTAAAIPDVPGAAPPAADPGLPRLRSVREVAALFGRSPRTIRGWAQDGRLKSVRVGSAVFFKTEDIEAVLANT